MKEQAQTYEHFVSAGLRKRGKVWQGIIRYKKEDGAWTSKCKSFPDCRLKREAEAALAKWRLKEERAWAKEFESGIVVPQTISEYLSHYIDTLESTAGAARSTIANYRYVLKHVALHPIGSVLIDELSAEMVEQWVADLVESGKSPATVRKAFNVMHVGVKHAVETHRLPFDPMMSVRLPKIPKRLPNVLEGPQRERLAMYLESMENTPINTAIAIALYTGMREGEICALRWSDCDLNNELITVQRSIGSDGNKTYVKEPKTASSLRTIPIAPSLADRLNERKQIVMRDCRIIGIPFSAELYVVGSLGSGSGKYLEPKMLWRSWKVVANSLGLVGSQGKVPSFHDLRHTYATTAIAGGADVKSVQGLLGHASASTTLNIYATQDTDAMRRAAALTAEAIGGRCSRSSNRSRPVAV